MNFLYFLLIFTKIFRVFDIFCEFFTKFYKNFIKNVHLRRAPLTFQKIFDIMDKKTYFYALSCMIMQNFCTHIAILT